MPNTKLLLLGACVLLAVSWSATVATASKLDGKPPNIVFILCDDLGHADVSSFAVDTPDLPTPAIDALVSEGVALRSHYSQEVCSPTRTSILTGRYPIRYGLLHHVYPTGTNFSLFTNETLVTKPLNDAGYESHAVGKWHLGFSKWEHLPLQRGFKSYLGFLSGEQDYIKHTESAGGKTGKDFRRGNAPEPVTGEYSTETYTREATNIINAYANDEADQAVHSPQEVPQHYIDRFNATIPNSARRAFAGMVAALDDGIANVTAALKTTGLWDSTVVIIASDNGGPTHAFSAHGASNYPFRGSKHTLWIRGVRTVGAVSGGIPEIKAVAGQNRTGLLHVTDYFPTLVRIASGQLGPLQNEGSSTYESPAGFPLDGVDQWDMIAHGSDSRRSEILHNYDPTVKDDPKGTCCGYAALRMGQWKLLINPGLPDGWYPAGDPSGPSVPPNSSVAVTVDGYEGSQQVSLFDVVSDPYELNDVATHHPDIVKNLTARINWYAAQALPMPNTPYLSAYDPDAQPPPNTGYWTPQGQIPEGE